MPQFADRVKVTSTSTGTGAITLSSTAVSGYQAFPSSLDGETVGYVIESGSAWEIGTGVYTHSSLQLSRSLRSSSTGSLLSLASGTHTVFLTPAYQDIQIVEAFSSTSDLPSASDNHGRVYHVHGEGALYFAHSGSWVKIANYSDITTYTHPNHSGEVTSTGDGATVIADGVVDEANLKVSNSPTDGYVLTARSGNTGGMTWEEASSGIALTDLSVTQNSASGSGALSYNNTTGSFTYTPPLLSGGGSSTTALSETTFSATANQTAFVVSGGITNAANITVFRNGVKLEEGISKDFTANAATNTVTLNSGAILNDVVEVLEYGQPGLALTDLSDTPSSLGTAGQTLLVNSGATGLEFGDAGSSVTVVQNLTGLGNITSPAAGDMALVTDLNNIYVRKTAGWYLIATITNQGPQTVAITMSGGGGGDSSAYTLASDGSTTSTATGSADPDREADTLTWSASAGTSTAFAATLTDGGSAVDITTSADTSTVLATISQSSNVFTITPSSSTTAPNGGTFSVTFAVTDGINTSVDNTTTFTLDFPPNYSGSPSSTVVTSGSWVNGDKIGFAIDLDADGDTLIIGGSSAKTGTTSATGEAYIYTRSGDNSWSQQKNVTASDANTGFDLFGGDVAISGDGNYAVIGMQGDDTSQSDSGAIYIWYKGTGAWSGGTQQAKKQASVVEQGAGFGFSVAIDSDGDTIVACAPSENVGYINGSRGAAYVFTRSGTTWTQQARLTISDYGSYGFQQVGTGCSISGDGNTIALAARNGQDGSGNAIGAVYVFTRSGSTWTEQKKLLPSGTATGTKFGYEGAIEISSDGNYIIVGAQWAAVSGNSTEGQAWIFYKGATSWASTGALQQRIEQTNGYASDIYGISVDISDDGSMAVVGAQQHDYPNGTQQGACYVYTRAGTSWSEQAKLYDGASYILGSSVAISGDNAYVAAGMPNYNTNRGGFKVWKG